MTGLASRAFAAGSVAVVALACKAAPVPSRVPPSVPSAAPSAAGTAVPPAPQTAAEEDAADTPEPPPPAPRDAGPEICEGSDVDLADVFSSVACTVPEPTAGPAATKLPPGVEVKLTSTPAKVFPGEDSEAKLVIANRGNGRAELYFHPRDGDFAVALELVDPRTLDRHLEGRMLRPAAPSELLRVVLAPGGAAHATFQWEVLRRVGGHPPPRTPPTEVPLTPGTYFLLAWTGLPGVSPLSADRARLPTAVFTVAPTPPGTPRLRRSRKYPSLD